MADLGAADDAPPLPDPSGAHYLLIHGRSGFAFRRADEAVPAFHFSFEEGHKLPLLFRHYNLGTVTYEEPRHERISLSAFNLGDLE